MLRATCVLGFAAGLGCIACGIGSGDREGGAGERDAGFDPWMRDLGGGSGSDASVSGDGGTGGGDGGVSGDGAVSGDGGVSGDGAVSGDGGGSAGSDGGGGTRPDPGPGPYTIGGRVTGLSAGGVLTLGLNGTEMLTVRADGDFTFTTRVARGLPYAVAVLTQPTGQTCTASGNSGTALHDVVTVVVACARSGAETTDWSIAPPPPAHTMRQFNDVYVADPDHVFIVGPLNTILVWDGSTFVAETGLPTDGRTFYAVSGTDRENVWVGGASSSILHYDGYGWREHVVSSGQNWQGLWTPSPRLRTNLSLWGSPSRESLIAWTPATLVWAVSSAGQVARWDGMRWVAVRLEGDIGEFFAIEGYDDDHVFIARDVGRINVRLNGGSWSRAYTGGLVTTDYEGIGVVQTREDDLETPEIDETTFEVFVVGGESGRGVALKATYTYVPPYLEPTPPPPPYVTWSPMSLPAGTPALHDLYVASPTQMWAVGDGGTILRGNGRTWTRLSAATTNNLRAVHGAGPTSVWAVGDRGTILRPR
jgi:hypothetical protein